MNKKVMFSTGKDTWETPDALFKQYDDIYHFVLDAAANETNHKCAEWLGPGGVHEDALVVSWQPWLTRGNVWLNPPYSSGLQQAFVKKVFEETYGKHGGSVVVLLPARTDTKTFHNYIWYKENVEVEFIKGRIKFKSDQPLRKGTSPNSAPFPSMICVFS